MFFPLIQQLEICALYKYMLDINACTYIHVCKGVEISPPFQVPEAEGEAAVELRVCAEMCPPCPLPALQGADPPAGLMSYLCRSLSFSGVS